MILVSCSSSNSSFTRCFVGFFRFLCDGGHTFLCILFRWKLLFPLECATFSKLAGLLSIHLITNDNNRYTSITQCIHTYSHPYMARKLSNITDYPKIKTEKERSQLFTWDYYCYFWVAVYWTANVFLVTFRISSESIGEAALNFIVIFWQHTFFSFFFFLRLFIYFSTLFRFSFRFHFP